MRILIISCLITLIALECLVRSTTVTEYLAHPIVNLEGINPYWKLKMIEDQKQGGDIVFLGSSRVRFGINPQVISKTIHDKSIFNLGIASIPPSASYFVLQKTFEMKHKPKIVVYGASEFEYNKNLPANLQESKRTEMTFVSKPSLELEKILLQQFIHSPSEIIDLFFFSHVRMIATGEAFRKAFLRAVTQFEIHLQDKSTFKQILKYVFILRDGDAAHVIDKNEYSNQGFFAMDQIISGQSVISNNAHWRYNTMNYQIDPIQKQFLEGMIQQANKNGAKFILINMPTHRDFNEIFPKKDKAVYKEMLESLSKKYNLTYVDGDSMQFEDLDFSDTNHLNATGSAKFSEEITKYLKQ